MDGNIWTQFKAKEDIGNGNTGRKRKNEARRNEIAKIETRNLNFFMGEIMF